ncbi:Low molecular weight protein tyrosine phosphatase (EC 3.1.3.48) [uncultured Gammaproteobacteria bacterium]|nr:Low molecular weight protein tyrosine phosphatase (EC 3.1.3.48) [uncultured Gammaproteobacteria bacterium]SHN91689.1 Low molecular weight protein tyrosine phosphatase [bacterium endosymbiont of Bathymodiolus sp. 5 South]CAC9652944.1 Low molecular weight protein tyrosine phosphatase (EC 3.1.3.48) [uncultured Gammaproteobacteria bacterium]SSC08488.1 Low molecular weight protein tyrosine phosphatase [bacterium endosymbiont of Bathymodiolus sp. 5 South]VVH60175.1 Low molecular weight protein tyr
MTNFFLTITGDLCINRNNHQKPTFHPLGDFLNPVLALLGQGLKNRQLGKNWILLIIPIYAKVSTVNFLIIIL